jgi:hypothetical protein
MPGYQIDLEHLCEVQAYVGAPIPVGQSSWGIRLILPVEEGVINGPRLKGTVRAFGADWGLVRPDNCFELDVRAIIETEDGAIIHTYYKGVVDMTQEQVDRLLKGEISEGLRLYVAPRFETGHPDYRWLTRIQAVGRGSVEPEAGRLKVTYSWYALSG